MKPIDPFQLKHLSKFHPIRLAFTLKARLLDRWSRLRFASHTIELMDPPEFQRADLVYAAEDTAVTLEQMNLLVHCLRVTEMNPAPAVEIGAYRGVTSALLAKTTDRKYIIVDPYIGYGGAETDLHSMQKRTEGLINISHLRMTSGEAGRNGGIEQISFAFIDAVHDYVNATFDGRMWAEKLVQGGLIAFHDTDSERFGGVQAAVWRMIHANELNLELFAHVEGVVVLIKRQ